MEEVKECTVLLPLLASLPPIPKDWKPSKQYLLLYNLGSLIHGNMMIIEKQCTFCTNFASSGTTGTGNVNRASFGPMFQEDKPIKEGLKPHGIEYSCSKKDGILKSQMKKYVVNT